MKKTRKWLSVALALVLVLLLAPVILPTAAEAAEDTSDGNVSITVDNATPNVGDTVTVTLSNEDMTVSVFTCGISFDTTKLQCTDINTIDSPITDSAKLVEPQLTTLDSTDVEAGTDANSTGRVGFGVVSVDQTSPHDKSIDAGDFLAVEFTVLEAGEITITAYEDSAGADGVTGDKGAKDVDSVKLNKVLLGDVNCDEAVDTKDILLLKRAVAGLTTLNEQQIANANVNHDSAIDTKDILMLKRAVAGLTTLS